MMASGAPQHQPTNPSELQLFRVLERANLLGYYDGFIQQGGDDVQQLCEAGEEEFLEIMALVGMATKPLHVRRLQKSLQEWVSNPSSFQQPMTSSSQVSGSPGAAVTPSPGGGMAASLTKWTHPVSGFPSPGASSKCSSEGSSEQVTLVSGYVLDDHTIQNIKEAAEYVVRGTEPLVDEVGKKTPKEIQQIIDMPLDDPRRLTGIRKYAAIYARFDSKRKTDKQLTQHEASVNEAAAQICVVEPMYLNHRDKLFPLSRQVVRESGYKFKHGHSRAGMSRLSTSGEDGPVAKKPKPAAPHPYRDSNVVPNPRTVQAELIKIKRQERMNEIQEALRLIKDEQKIIKDKTEQAKLKENLQRVYDLQLELEKLTTQQLVLMTEQTDLIKRQRRSDRYYVAKARLSAEVDSGYYDKEDGDVSSVENGNIDNTDSNIGQNSVASSNMSSSPQDSNENSQQERGGGDVPSYALPPKKNLASTQKILMQHTLFDEGLRLVQQHTLAYDDEYPELQQRQSRSKAAAKVKREEGGNSDNGSMSSNDEDEEEEEEEEEEENGEGTSDADKAAQSTINAILKLRSKTDPVIKEEPRVES